MENAKGKMWNSTKKSGETNMTCKFQPVSVEADEEQRAAGEPSMQKTSGKGTKRKKPIEDDKASCPQKMAQDDKKVKLRKKIPIPPLPSILPPVNLLHRDIVRAWCQQLKLCTKGLKLDVYRRLCEYAYPDQKDIPITAKEAKILTKSQIKLKLKRGEIMLESSHPSEVTAVLKEGASVLEGSTALLDEMDNVVMTSSTPNAVFASWTRIAARAGKIEAVKSSQEASRVMWCVVHGRSLPADTEGWVQLQFYAGQAWVPEKQGRVCALFLLPACNFPPLHLEDNMLCPKCVHRNKVLMKSLQ
ncbi:developmental pluripotency-associated protein 4 isoform X2 [Rousettus aegyptiacus]|uniref:Developmental pluripotency associated 4 n=1 Tax=Rousettus aegyptiacus TaxID=9407 RepID=A0A7J8HPX8_ROUAE|nr:developmental pluripotency-associated protein 4 isoform X2 [Rousettus aegyptiacus]KAF6473939.1 developmental pluripotency associated 4 [Rousettus aegyptiacus]